MGNRGLEQRGKKSKTYPPKEVTQTVRLSKCFIKNIISWSLAVKYLVE